MDSCEVFYHHIRIIDPPKAKFILCVCPIECYFFYINSNPPIAPNAGVEVTPNDLTCLDHVSYIDTSFLVNLTILGIDDDSRRGKLSLPLRRRVVKCAQDHGILAERYLKILESNFLK